ncbi:MAG: PrsW family intramembrane metalloprotease [Haloferacaceae archaeon]
MARWEVSRGVAGVDRRTVVLAVVALVVGAGVVGAAASVGGGVALDGDIYRVGVDEGSVYRPAVADRASLDAAPAEPAAFARGDLEVLVPPDPVVDDGTLRVTLAAPGGTSAAAASEILDRGIVLAVDSRKGRAALSALRGAVADYNNRRMAEERNQSAAFPVIVTLQYVERGELEVGTGADAGTGGDGATTGGTSTATPTPAAGQGSVGGGGGAADDGGSGGLFGSGGPLAVPSIGGGGLFGTGQSGSPADIQPPFPFSSLLLAFVFLIPMNFVTQAYGSSVLDERVNRRGELLLVAPIAPGDIVAGKTLPYLTALVAVTALIAAAVGGGLLSVVAVVPVALVYLAATFVGGMFARSFKELTFVTVTISVFLSSYTFVPAIFTEVTPIALISPLTLVVRDLQGAGATAGEVAFSTGPFLLSAGLLFLLGTGVYREEDMFTQRPVPLKFLDALDARLSGRWSVALVSALVIPFVFIAELLAVAVLFVLPFGVSLPLLLATIAAIEEVAKSAHVYAGFSKGRFERSVASALGLGALSGLGFFLGEKLTAIVQVVGLPEVALGRAAFAPAGIGIGTTAALVVAPLVLHAVTAAITAIGASRTDRRWYLGTLVVATAVHALYNLTVVVILG